MASGTAVFSKGKLIAGVVEIDMNSIVNEDVPSEKYNKKLVNHLKSPHFFETSVYPKAYFHLTNVNIPTDDIASMACDVGSGRDSCRLALKGGGVGALASPSPDIDDMARIRLPVGVGDGDSSKKSSLYLLGIFADAKSSSLKDMINQHYYSNELFSVYFQP